jgi:hypothetical protein
MVRERVPMPIRGEGDRRRRLLADLDTIQESIDRGNVEEARERLCALPLIATPLDECAAEIGQLFLNFDYPEMAARFWYYVDDRTEAMEKIVKRFEESCGNNPEVIRQSVGGFWKPGWPANGRIHDLERAESKLRQEFDYEYAQPAPHWRDRLSLLGCGLIAFALLFVLTMGLIFIGKLVSEDI